MMPVHHQIFFDVRRRFESASISGQNIMLHQNNHSMPRTEVCLSPLHSPPTQTVHACQSPSLRSPGTGATAAGFCCQASRIALQFSCTYDGVSGGCSIRLGQDNREEGDGAHLHALTKLKRASDTGTPCTAALLGFGPITMHCVHSSKSTQHPGVTTLIGMVKSARMQSSTFPTEFRVGTQGSLRLPIP